MMDVVRVVIVDDHPVIRQGILGLLSAAEGIEVIGETGSGEDALRMARELRPDVLLLDMEIRGISGIEVAKTLQKEGSRVAVLALSAHDDREYVEELLKCGAAGYLLKEDVPELILAAVKGVASGEHGWISRRVVAQFSNWQQETPEGIGSDLTPREVQVLEQLTDGKTNREIGKILSISVKTIEKHLESIFRKLGVTSRTEAAVWKARDQT
jgi:two-component system, NarL family, nitrate/nitrite response regulator NarL